MYRASEVAASKAREEQKQALLGRAFDRVIASQLAKVKQALPAKDVQSEEDFKRGLAEEREKAEKKGGKKMTARALELSRQGLSGAVVQMMLKEEGLEEEDSGSGSDSESSRNKKKRKKTSKKGKKEKKEKKEKKRKKSKKEKKHKKEKKSGKKRKRDESSSSSSESDSDSATEPPDPAPIVDPETSRVRTRSMDSKDKTSEI